MRYLTKRKKRHNKTRRNKTKHRKQRGGVDGESQSDTAEPNTNLSFNNELIIKIVNFREGIRQSSQVNSTTNSETDSRTLEDLIYSAVNYYEDKLIDGNEYALKSGEKKEEYLQELRENSITYLRGLRDAGVTLGEIYPYFRIISKLNGSKNYSEIVTWSKIISKFYGVKNDALQAGYSKEEIIEHNERIREKKRI
jgi:hypothetical protein